MHFRVLALLEVEKGFEWKFFSNKKCCLNINLLQGLLLAPAEGIGLWPRLFFALWAKKVFLLTCYELMKLGVLAK